MTLNPDQRVIRCTPVEILLLTELMRDGASNAELAKRLHLSIDTIKTHFKRIYLRLPMLTRIQFVLGLERGQIVVIDTKGRVVEF